jgi:hypothetical protein
VEAGGGGGEARAQEGRCVTQQPTTTTMTYTHLRAWLVIGGIAMPPNTDKLPLVSGDGWSYTLQRDIDETCFLSDRGAALAHLMLLGAFGPTKVGTLEERLGEGVSEIRKARRSKTGSYPVLLFESKGKVEVTLGEPAQRHNDFVLTFDAFDKTDIRQAFVRQHRSIQLALAMESNSRLRFDDATTGMYCTDDGGLTVYSLSMTMGGAEAIGSSLLAQGATERLHQRFAQLNKSAELDSCMRLFADMAIYGREPFRVFNSGWSAFEILINKTFKEYEERFFSTLQLPHQPDMAALYLESVRKKLEGKHSLVDRFTMVSSVLLPDQSSGAAQTDVASFKEIKLLRDKIAHGSEFDEGRMPITQLSDLLMKYLNAHTVRAMNSKSSLASTVQTDNTHV